MGLFGFFSNKKKEIKPTYTKNKPEISEPSLKPEKYSYKNIYAQTVFLYYCRKSKPIGAPDDYPRYFLYNFNIANPSLYHKKLLSEGYLQEAPINELLSSLKVTELKNILETNNLPKTGKKAELIKRIVDSIPEDKIMVSFTEKIYSLSDKGLLFLKDHDDYVQLFQHSSYQISIDEYEKTKKELRNYTKFNDIAWNIFNKRTLDYAAQKNYGLLRNTYFEMGELLEEETKNKQSLSLYLTALLYDVSGIENLKTILYYIDGAYSKKDLKDLYIEPFFVPGLLGRIEKLSDFYEDGMAADVYKKHYLDMNLCSCEKFNDLVCEILYEPTLDEEKWKEYFKKNFTSLIKDLECK